MMRVGIILLVSVAVAAWAVAGAASRPAYAQVPGSFAVTVRGVESADTLSVVFGGRQERVRLIGVSVPDCMTDEAYSRLIGLARGRVAFLELDYQDRDDDNAVLGYLWIDNVMVNTRLVSEGYARAATGGYNRRYDDALSAAHARASKLVVGLWRNYNC